MQMLLHIFFYVLFATLAVSINTFLSFKFSKPFCMFDIHMYIFSIILEFFKLFNLTIFRIFKEYADMAKNFATNYEILNF